MHKPARGERNKNPMNMRRSRDAWKGLSKTQTDKDFFQFDDVVYGIRAGIKNLLNYPNRRKLYTIEQIIPVYAPAIENDVEAYIRRVVIDSGIPRNRRIDFTSHSDMAPLVKAMIKHELGYNPYPDRVIDEALALTGILFQDGR
jgi:hypothetical protein